MKTLTLPAQEIPKQKIADLLCSALEGGSNYWYRIEKYGKPDKLESWTGLKGVYRHIDYPMSPGGYLMISDGAEARDEEIRTERLDLPAMVRGLAVMREKHPRHFANFMRDNADGETGDVFLQCCLFGETVYG